MRPVTSAQIEVRAIAKQWVTRDHPVPALEAVSLDIAPQEFLTVLGPSGCGKSTLLSIIGGLTTPDSGEVRIAGRPVTGPDPRQMAMVFQDPGLFPWRTALENVEFGLELQGMPAQARRERARALLEPGLDVPYTVEMLILPAASASATRRSSPGSSSSSTDRM